MSKEKEWHPLRRKVMYAEDFDAEIEAWNEIDVNLKLFDFVKKHVSEITLGLLVSGNFQSIQIELKEVKAS